MADVIEGSGPGASGAEVPGAAGSWAAASGPAAPGPATPGSAAHERGRGTSRVGGALTAIGVALSIVASVLTGLLLNHAERTLPYRTVKEALDHGDGAAYAPSVVCAASQVLWVALVFVGFILLVIGFARGYRRTWVWIAAVLGPVGLLVSVSTFVVTLGLAA
jgi:vacuolar-type H+-ATPase subunit I/STV1